MPKSDSINRLIPLSVIPLSGVHCIVLKVHEDLWGFVGSFVKSIENWLNSWSTTQNKSFQVRIHDPWYKPNPDLWSTSQNEFMDSRDKSTGAQFPDTIPATLIISRIIFIRVRLFSQSKHPGEKQRSLIFIFKHNVWIQSDFNYRVISLISVVLLGPLNGIAVGSRQTDFMKQMIPLTDTHMARLTVQRP